ncbi:MAG: hypothetical protein WC511_02950 [Candidatus Pacearchaeota archaeon]
MSSNNLRDKVSSRNDLTLSEVHSIDDKILVRGSVKCFVEENGVVTLHHEKHNLIVNGARKALAHLIGEALTAYRVDMFKLGTGGHLPGDILTPVSPTITDTDLEEPFFSKALDHGSDVYNPASPNETSITFTVAIEKYEGNGTGIVPYTEAGLVTQNGTLFARETFPAIVKNSSRKVTFQWSILF